MWSGEAHVLEEGRMILLNSALAATNFSGDRRRGRAKTGRPSVTMWWDTPCLTGVSLVQGVVNDGKSFRSRRKGSPAGSGVETELMRRAGSGEGSASTRVPFRVSIRRRCSKSTNNLCCSRKSAPTIGCVTSATRNRQVRGRGNPKSRVNCRKP